MAVIARQFGFNRRRFDDMSTLVTDTPAMSPSRDPKARQISPQIAAALLAKPRPELTGPQRAIVVALKAGCPGYAVMRPLMLGFRSLLRHPTTPSTKARTTVALRRWMDRAQATGIRSLQHFVERLRRDVLAVEAAVLHRRSCARHVIVITCSTPS
jgi:hypothetical protein